MEQANVNMNQAIESVLSKYEGIGKDIVDAEIKLSQQRAMENAYITVTNGITAIPTKYQPSQV